MNELQNIYNFFSTVQTYNTYLTVAPETDKGNKIIIFYEDNEPLQNLCNKNEQAGFLTVRVFMVSDNIGNNLDTFIFLKNEIITSGMGEISELNQTFDLEQQESHISFKLRSVYV